MTAEIRIQIASKEHRTKQPEGLPYALFCEPVLAGDGLIECPSRGRLGFLGNFKLERKVREAGLAHPHAVLIRVFSNSR